MRQCDIDDAAAHFAVGPTLHLDWRAVHHRLWRRYEALTRRVRVLFTEVDPYESADAMRAEYHAGQLYIFAGTNEFLPRDVHLALRAIHDADHCDWGVGFDAGGEWAAVRAAAAREPALECFWASEILGQVCTFFAAGAFPAHRPVRGMSRWLRDHALPHNCLTRPR